MTTTVQKNIKINLGQKRAVKLAKAAKLRNMNVNDMIIDAIDKNYTGCSEDLPLKKRLEAVRKGAKLNLPAPSPKQMKAEIVAGFLK